MSNDSRSHFFFNNRRSAVKIACLPGFRLGPPLTILAMSLVFAVLCGFLGHTTYASLLALDPPTAQDSGYYANLIDEQVSSALIAIAVLASLYALGVVGVWFWHALRAVGPEIALRRQVEALKNGDYEARVNLRPGDAFVGLAEDLNDLAAILAADEKPDERRSAPTGD